MSYNIKASEMKRDLSWIVTRNGWMVAAFQHNGEVENYALNLRDNGPAYDIQVQTST